MNNSQDTKNSQPEQERCVGCEACIDTACGRDECPKGWPKAVQPEQELTNLERHEKNVQKFLGNAPQPKEPEQEPVAITTGVYGGRFTYVTNKPHVILPDGMGLYASPQRKPLTDEQIDFLNFLYGSGEWDGVWFEGKHPAKRGAFWWRKDMKRLFDYNNKEK